MVAYVFCKMPGNYNDGIIGSAYSDMSDEESNSAVNYTTR